MIRILANPRSGTTSLSRTLIKDLGLDVPHEKVGEDGTVSCFFWTDSKIYPTGKTGKPAHPGDGVPSEYDWDKTIHLVRHPLKCIPSMRSIVGRDQQQWLYDKGLIRDTHRKPKLLFSMEAWYETNLAIERLKPNFRIQIENVDWKKLGKALGTKQIPEVTRHLNRATGFLEPKPIAWEDMEALDSKLTAKIKRMALKYKYEV